MPDIIQLLPDSVANQIAAGEVIQRPASAVKELMENAVDSGATEISLIVKDAGRTLIQVVDNGCGMSERDARMCFERHATSKIRNAKDLFAIRTLGFRGEALASLAAVSQLDMKSRRHEDELGTCIEVEGSKVRKQSPCSCPAGTTFIAKNLFFNMPARRNFLKSDTSELRHITDEFFRVALVSNEIRFNFHHNGQLLYQLHPGNRKQRISGLFGNAMNERLVALDHHTEALDIHGFIGKPEFARKTRGEQYFFVNGRYIRHPYLHHAVENAYHELIPKENIPTYFIFIETDPSTIDINIHPTKTEVNFLDSKVIYSVIRATVKQALGINNLMPSIDFDVEQSLDFSPPGRNTPIINPFNRPPSDYNPFESGKKPERSYTPPDKPDIRNWQSLYDLGNIKIEKSEDDKSIHIDPEWTNDTNKDVPAQVFQLQNSYLITSIKSGLLIIDQQRAHERILFEKYLRRLESRKQTSQQEMFPHQVSFSPADAELLEEILEELRIIGFHLNKLGKNTFVIVGTPSGLKENDLQGLLENLLDRYKKNLVDLNLDKTINLARSMAVTLSLKSGKPLYTEEMNHLIDELFSTRVADHTPDGRKVFVIVPLNDIKTLLDK